METKGKVAVVGSGLIGRSWAVLFSKAGYSVCLYDTDVKQLEAALGSIKTTLDEFENKELLCGPIKTANDAFKLISTTESLSEVVKDSIFLQESTPENLELKQKVFKQLDELASDDIVLSSSSSCLYPSMFTTNLKHKSQCIVSHPVNPPYLVPLVEVVPSPDTDKAIIDKTMDIMKDIGQAPVLVRKEVNGFLLNRLQYAVLMEAWRLVEDGVCTPEDIDTTMTEGLGLRYSLIGPFETIHLNAPQGVKDYCERYGANIEVISKEQSDTRSWSGTTVDRIHEAMCKTMPVESLPKRRELRDKRLAALALHRSKEDS
ncbi:lambda-crystallin-like [Hydractinia symbiolongicarpus]|uniref:lambda-crystallin-like n=1 Tax=Hydractinia symbiolongicarpus TaxID=13093 RepID=UPI00255141D7|nr:lambda-crystallin-like [Hydractinia symbiolongicarpus]